MCFEISDWQLCFVQIKWFGLYLRRGQKKEFAYKVKHSSQPERISSVIITPTAVQTWSWLMKWVFLIMDFDILYLG